MPDRLFLMLRIVFTLNIEWAALHQNNIVSGLYAVYVAYELLYYV